ncbi:tetratricopeptide repeat protein [Duganella sp. FT135W]|uniref:Tetratricopeptide repeat protein n=1 Tax=Duganella flavida TaxID=2692175 RepID=A0A6L8KHR8_9BURK|nr:tetratricopeptide repeat protein [Duganella flavida]MYM25342.1 tetratricopeptide repeat protein [Duganella flavida]
MEPNPLILPPLSTSGEVITFYSYKGGTGRTMALSNIGVLLARQQNATTPVLMIDWDLEAPGLHHYFPDPHQDDRPGVLELFEACREQLQRRRNGLAAQDDEALAHEVLAAVGWEQYVSRVDQGSQLYLMRAGRFDDSYGERLAAMHWEELFNSCPALFRCFGERLSRHFRHVLVDSRTGRTDSAGICTTLLPRKLVVVFTPNRQSLEGVQALVTRATVYRRSHEDEQRPLLVYPLPSRIEMGDSAQRSQWRRGDERQRILGYQPSFEALIRDCYGMQQVSLESYFDEVQLQQTRIFAYGEQVAVRLDQGGDRFSLTRTFEAFLEWLAPGYFPWQSHREIKLLASIDEARRTLEAGGGAARAVSQLLAHDLSLLGDLYRREGKLRPALALLEEGLVLRQRGLGEDHPDTLSSKTRLAAALRQQGKLEEALFLDECVVEARERLLGAEHVDTLAARSNQAITLGQQGRVAEALAIQDAIIDAYVRLLGPEHLLTLSAKAARADLLLLRGDLEHARNLQEQVLAARKRLLGAEHADTLRSKTALAHTLLRMQELDAARSLLEAVLHAHLRRLGPEHPESATAREQLTDIHLQLGIPPGELPLVHELHQNAAMDDYGDALALSGRSRGQHPANGLWARSTDELMALDGYLSSPRPPSR